MHFEMKRNMITVGCLGMPFLENTDLVSYLISSVDNLWVFVQYQLWATSQNASLQFLHGGLHDQRGSLWFFGWNCCSHSQSAPWDVLFRSGTRSFWPWHSFVEHIGLLGVTFPGLTGEALRNYCSVSNHQYDTFVSTGADWCQCCFAQSLWCAFFTAILQLYQIQLLSWADWAQFFCCL